MALSTQPYCTFRYVQIHYTQNFNVTHMAMHTLVVIAKCAFSNSWASQKAFGLWKREWWDGGLVVWNEVQLTCMWSIWCHCLPIISCFIKTQNGLFSGTGLSRLSWKRSHQMRISAIVIVKFSNTLSQSSWNKSSRTFKILTMTKITGIKHKLYHKDSLQQSSEQ